MADIGALIQSVYNNPKKPISKLVQFDGSIYVIISILHLISNLFFNLLILKVDSGETRKNKASLSSEKTVKDGKAYKYFKIKFLKIQEWWAEIRMEFSFPHRKLICL